MKQFITRFAPSPTGLLHLGHAYSALVAFEAARAAEGKFILRMEDIDQARCKSEFEAAIYEDLAWLGVCWEEPVRRQSEHFKDYTKTLTQLRDKNLVYRCFKTRKEITADIARAPHLPPEGLVSAQYTGAPLATSEERARIARGEVFAWRLSLKEARKYLGARFDDLAFNEIGAGPKGQTGRITAQADLFGDAVVARKDFGTSYHIACVHDDALQGVTHIIRGQDLFLVTHLHRLLQALLDLPAPVYKHHRLIEDEDGMRMAKRDQSIKLRSLRESGVTPAEIRQRIGL